MSVSDIATSLGALVAAGSLAAGFVLYRFNQRDAMAAQFSQSIGAARPIANQLQQMVSYELASDLAGAALYSRDLTIPFRDLYMFCRPASGQGPSREDVEKYLGEIFPVVTVPLATSLVYRYESQVTALSSGVALYQEAFPGAYRVVNSMALLCQGVLVTAKELVRDDDRWESLLLDVAMDEDIPSLAHMKWHMGERLTVEAMGHLAAIKSKVDLLTKMIAITFDAYLRMTAKELKRTSRSERKERVSSVESTRSIDEDLRGAERCLRHVFSAEEMAVYSQYVSEYEGKPSDD